MAVYPYESTASNELAGPWRRAALVAVAIAGVELVVLIVLVGALVAKPLSQHLHHRATATPALPAHPRATHTPAPAKLAAATRGPMLARSRTRVLVLNGNGRQGAAGAEASALQARGYRIAATGNAGRSNYATSIVMYSPGYEREARRLAHDASVRVVAPIDGLRASALRGAQLALVVGS